MPFKPLPITDDVAEGGFKSLPLKDTGAFKPIQIKSPTPEVEQETPYMAQHPNLYAAKETAKDLAKDILPYVKYFDPEEREDFMKLDKQHQVRALLKENLFSQLFMLPGSKGFKYGMGKATGWFAKNFPKTAKALTKPRMVSKLQQEEAVIESAKQTPAVKKVIAALKEAKPLRKEQEAIYTQVRGERLAKLKKIGEKTSGEEGFYKQLGALKGEMKPKVQFESIRKSGSKFFDESTTKIGRYDKLLKKGDAKIVRMSPDEYMVRQAEATGRPQNLVHEKGQIEGYSDRMLAGEKAPMPVIDYEWKAQEGRARALAAKRAGAEEIPVVVMGKPPVKSVIKKQFDKTSKLIGQEEANSLFNEIKTSSLGEWDKLPAGKGLAKMFGEFGGGVPTENELAKMTEVFGSELTDTLLSKREMFVKFKEAGLEVANIPRALMASYDLSAPLRQGVFLVGKPKHWFSSFKSMFKPAVSERAYQQLQKEITSRPTFELMKDSGLSITELGGLLSREERFMSNYAEKIPIIGRGVRGSGRAYTSFLNKLRADFFDEFVGKGTKLGIKDPKFLKDAAKYINTATGRGGLGSLETSAVALNSWFFSPRLIMSRIQMLNPQFYATLHPTVRKEALKNLFTFGSVALGTAGLALYGGAKVGFDPRSADFMKIKVGNTRYDILGGFQQPIRLAAQVISGKVISSTTGKTMVLGEGYRGLTRTEIMSRYLEYKQAPVISFGVGLLRGKTSLGEKFDLPTEVANRFIPMVAQDVNDLYKEKGLKGIPMASPAIFGVGVQSYGGVNSFGLNGKDYPKLNNELLRLKTSMGFPSSVAFGEALTNKEYKRLKIKTGKEVANFLDKLIGTPSYKNKSDIHKLRMVEHKIDIIKDRTKKKMFPMKRRKGRIKSRLKSMRGLSDEEASKQADEILKRKK